MKPNYTLLKTTNVENVETNAAINTSYFTAAQLAQIYKFPAPSTAANVVGVMSFGGGLYGTTSNTSSADNFF